MSMTVQDYLSQQILDNIAQKGLLPKKLRGAVPCLLAEEGGKKQGGHDLLCLNEFSFKKAPGKTPLEKVQPLANIFGAGIWSILLERDFKLGKPWITSSKDLKSEFENRLAASVVDIFKPQKDYLAKLDNYLFPEDGGMLVPFQECRTEKPVKIEDLCAKLVPIPILEMVQKKFPTVLCIGVPLRKIAIPIPIFETEKYWPSKKMECLDEKFKFFMMAPDYPKGLETLVTTHKIEDFACHAVRLITKLDAAYQLANKNPMFLKALEQMEMESKLSAEKGEKPKTMGTASPAPQVEGTAVTFSSREREITKPIPSPHGSTQRTTTVASP